MRVLIAEDDRASRGMLQELLESWGYDVTAVSDGDEALAVLRESDSPRLAILDWIMPGIDGLDVCTRLRADENAFDAYTYIILLTVRNSREDLVRGMEGGADDYVFKPFNHQELKVRLKAGRRIVDLQAQLREARRRLEFEASHDSLTRALNRRATLARLDEELSRAVRNGSAVTIGIMDVDHFKAVNDTYGHPAGDLVLQECVGRMLSATRPFDVLGRFGGEEFLLIAPHDGDADMRALFERIRRDVEEEKFIAYGHEIGVTLSGGVATGQPGEDKVDLIHRADDALYEAKDRGRNCIVVV